MYHQGLVPFRIQLRADLDDFLSNHSIVSYHPLLDDVINLSNHQIFVPSVVGWLKVVRLHC